MTFYLLFYVLLSSFQTQTLFNLYSESTCNSAKPILNQLTSLHNPAFSIKLSNLTSSQFPITSHYFSGIPLTSDFDSDMCPLCCFISTCDFEPVPLEYQFPIFQLSHVVGVLQIYYLFSCAGG